MSQRFLGSLNVFVAGIVLLTMTVGWILYLPLMFILTPLFNAFGVSAIESAGLQALVTPVVIGAFLAYRWVRRGSLEPELGEPSNPRRYRLGHALLLGFNLILIAWFVSTLAGMRLDQVYDSVGNAGVALFIYSLPLGFVLGLGGAAALWSSRRAPAGRETRGSS